MGLALFPECLGGGVKGTEDASDIALGHAEHREFARDRGRVRALGRPEATVAAPAVSRADRAAAGLGNGAEAGCSLRDHDTDGATQFAFVAHSVSGDRRLAPDQKSLDHLEQLALIDWAAAQLEIDAHVSADFELRGYTIEKGQLLEVIKALLIGRKPSIP